MTNWSIGIFVGDDPLRLAPAAAAANPVLTRDHVTNVTARFVADPFMIRADGLWHMFFEVMPVERRVGVIGHATSHGGCSWACREIVLREPFHLSYPLVFESKGAYYMLPETHQAGGTRLYRAVRFPEEWTHAGTLVEGDLADPTIFRFEGRWWMFAATPARHALDLHLFHAPDLSGPWREHPMSPVVRGDPVRARPAGRVVPHGGSLLRFAQDGSRRYGASVRAYEIVELSRTCYRERPAADAPLLGATGIGWNAHRMHHLDLHAVGPGRWLACVDGDGNG